MFGRSLKGSSMVCSVPPPKKLLGLFGPLSKRILMMFSPSSKKILDPSTKRILILSILQKDPQGVHTPQSLLQTLLWVFGPSSKRYLNRCVLSILQKDPQSVCSAPPPIKSLIHPPRESFDPSSKRILNPCVQSLLQENPWSTLQENPLVHPPRGSSIHVFSPCSKKIHDPPSKKILWSILQKDPRWVCSVPPQAADRDWEMCVSCRPHLLGQWRRQDAIRAIRGLTCQETQIPFVSPPADTRTGEQPTMPEEAKMGALAI